MTSLAYAQIRTSIIKGETTLSAEISSMFITSACPLELRANRLANQYAYGSN